MLRCEVVGILADGSAGHGEGRAVAVDWECLLVGRACYWLSYVHWTRPWGLIGYMGVRRGDLLTQRVRSWCAGGAARRDWC